MKIKRIKTVVPLGFCAALLCFSLPTNAGLLTERVTSDRSPAPKVSGWEGASTLTVRIGSNVNLPNPAAYYGITRIDIQEVKDNPCFVRLVGRVLNAEPEAEDRILGEANTDCGKPVTPWLDYKTAGFIERERFFIRGVKVCEAGGFITNNRELKGLEVFAAHVGTDGKVTPKDRSASFERPHCKQWHDAVMCPSDEIVNELVMHVRGNSFTGMALQCAKVKSAVTRPLVKDEQGF